MLRRFPLVVVTMLIWGLTPMASAGASWIEKLSVSSDFRYRFERIDQEGKDAYDRHRVRARVALKTAVNEDVSLTMRLASGSSDPVSTNQTLDGGFTSKTIQLDRAFIDYQIVPSAELNGTGGKMSNPFHRPQKSQLIWDGDLTLEGLAASVSHNADQINVFAKAGGFIANQRKGNDDTIVYGGQAGLIYAPEDRPVKVTAGAGVFSWANTKDFGLLVDSADGFGNSVMEVEGDLVYAEDYSLIEAFAEVGTELGSLPATFYGDFVSNSEPSENNTGWLIGFVLGKAKKPGAFKVGYNYRELESDAVVGAFCDSDFIGGGTNGKGHAISAAAAINSGVQGAVTFFSNTKNFGADQEEQGYERLQIDFKVKV